MTSIAETFNKNNNAKEVVVKVTIVGDSHVGKTTLLVKYIEDRFDEEFIETLGINVMEKKIPLSNITANLQIYDLGGQRQFAELMPTAMEEAKAVIFSFNLIQEATLMNVKRWFKDARSHNKVFKAILVGTKYDLFAKKSSKYKQEITSTARKFAEHMHAPLIYCSSMTNVHIKQIFTVLVGSVFQVKIKSKMRHECQNEPLLEYDNIYKNSKKKKKKKKHNHNNDNDTSD